MPNRVAFTLVTGFLGAGKTTLINRLLRDAALSDTAVIVNEFGAVSIDHLLVEEASDGVIELADGCLCCTVRGALVDTLLGLDERLGSERGTDLKRVVVETTGLADPLPVLQALAAHPSLAARFRLDGVVTLVDAQHGRKTLEAYHEARQQVAIADRLILTKTAQVEPGALSDLRHYLTRLAPGLELLAAEDMEAAAIIDCCALEIGARAAEAAHVAAPHHHEHSHKSEDGVAHSSAFDTVLLRHDRAIGHAALEGFLDLLRSQCGQKILRLKGIVELCEAPDRPLVVQGVRQVLYEPRFLEKWPDEVRGVRLVVIGAGLDEVWLKGLFAAFMGDAAVDTPDRTALENNPLAIAGMMPR